MRVHNHIAFRSDNHPQIIGYLIKHNIPFSQGKIISTLDMASDDQYWPNIKSILSETGLRYSSETEYSTEELSSAEWLTIRSQWRCGYPQPENAMGYKLFTYSKDNLCPQCGSGIIQTKPFCTIKTPNWGTRHFMMLNWVEDQLFMDDSAKQILTSGGVSGFSCQPVLDKKGQKELPNVKQLVVHNKLAFGIVSNRPSIDQTMSCNVCGIDKYHPTGIGMLAFQKEIFDGAADIMKTSEIFGWGNAAAHRIVIRKNVYELLNKHNLARGLVFEPLELV